MHYYLLVVPVAVKSCWVFYQKYFVENFLTLRNIFETGELEKEATVRNFLTVQPEGERGNKCKNCTSSKGRRKRSCPKFILLQPAAVCAKIALTESLTNKKLFINHFNYFKCKTIHR